MRRLLGYARPYRWRVVGAVALIVLSSLLQLVGPLATAVALDLFIRPGEAVAPVSRWTADHLLAGRTVAPEVGLAWVAGGATTVRAAGPYRSSSEPICTSTQVTFSPA